MIRTLLNPALFLFLAMFPALFLFPAPSSYAQSPQGIPYQAVMRNTDGSVMASSAVNLTFMIHDDTANGTVVYQESHSLTSNAQGLVSCVVGNGTASQGTFESINWGNGPKFLHVIMGTTDLGTQQMLSVPYGLHAGSTNVSVSPTGDTLTVGAQSVIVPGISAANLPPVSFSSGLGSQVLSGNIIAQSEYIALPGCQGETSILYFGIDYPIVEINGQCWFAKNLQTSQFQNGESIQLMNDSAIWMSSNFPGYCYQNGNLQSQTTYGNLYNWYSLIDDRNICPVGWHVPNDAEWMYLENSTGISVSDQQLLNQSRGCSVNAGGKLKLSGLWTTPYDAYTNELEFSALPAGYRNASEASFSGMGSVAAYFSLNAYQNNYVVGRFLDPWFGGPGCISRFGFDNRGAGSVRCVRDDAGMIKGCRNPYACNYDSDANFEDGSCLIIGNRCIDDNANTINDIIDANCECTGATIVNGCSNPQACNYNASANVDNGSCLIQGAACNDNNANTTNDVINGECVCAGTFNVAIGQDYQGGKLAYVFQPGDLGYVAGETHGLIAAPGDLGAYQWSCFGSAISGADGGSIGLGMQNTVDIVTAGCGGAAYACANLFLNGYGDWFLPSRDELQILSNNQGVIGGFQNNWYWTSTEVDSSTSWRLYFGGNLVNVFGGKYFEHLVRAVRYF